MGTQPYQVTLRNAQALVLLIAFGPQAMRHIADITRLALCMSPQDQGHVRHPAHLHSVAE